jgi:hypothetical protein
LLKSISGFVRCDMLTTWWHRRCLLAGAFSKAMVALQSAVEIAEMPSLAYRQGVLQSAQVLRAAHEFEASITCMQVSVVTTTMSRHIGAHPYFTSTDNLPTHAHAIHSRCWRSHHRKSVQTSCLVVHLDL